jgi:hypothetical protein
MIVCLGCANLTSDDNRGGSCSKCGVQLSPDVYGKLLAYAERLVRYGYQYRGLYEDEVRDGEEQRRHYLLPLHEIFNFIGLAVLSGIVGNTAHELVKAAIGRIREQARTEKLVDPAILARLDSEISQLELYLIELTVDPRRIDRRVLSAILDEAFVDLTIELRYSVAASAEVATPSPDFTQDRAEHVNASAEATSRLTAQFLPPEGVDWDDLWKNAGS